jgi:signal peptidase I
MGDLILAFTKNGNSIKLKAKGHSMFPFIKDGDILTIAPYNGLNPELGDIAAFFNSITSKLTIHRIIGIADKKYMAKGDCCFHNDGYQMKHNLLGAVADIKDKSFETKFVTHPKIKKIITLFSIINVTYYIGSIWRYMLSVKTFK